jgi:putative addiction module component (TIGR02574 family)
MSATQVVQQFSMLPFEERREAFEQIREIAEKDFSAELTPEQIAELDRRADGALKNPGRGIPWEQLRDETLSKYKK